MSSAEGEVSVVFISFQLVSLKLKKIATKDLKKQEQNEVEAAKY